MFSGLPSAAFFGSQTVVQYDEIGDDIVDPDVFVDAKSPGGAVNLIVVVEPGVVLASSGATRPTLDFSLFDDDTIITIINRGDIYAAGGDGGLGYKIIPASAPPSRQVNGCGGGGAGRAAGSGGFGTDSDTGKSHGDDGTFTTGGDGGVSTVTSNPLEFLGYDEGTFAPATNGQVGGDAINAAGKRVALFNEGDIWGGGGGGGGGSARTGAAFVGTGGVGGAPGLPGEDGTVDSGSFNSAPTPNIRALGGAAGYAVRAASLQIISDTGDIVGPTS